MKTLGAILLLVYMYPVQAQKQLVVDAFSLGHFRRFHVLQNETMTYKLKGSTHREIHRIVDMDDSTLYIETGELIKISEIRKVIFDRSNFLTRMLAGAFRVAGIGYIALDVVNSAANHDDTVFRERVLLVGGILFVVGECLHLANKKRVRIGKHGTLKVLDLRLN